MSVLRAKRQRAATAARRTRSASEDMADDYLLHMDPSAMTERQQLAFLLRKTAQEQEPGSANTASEATAPLSDASGDEGKRARSKSKKRIHRTLSASSKASPKSNARGDASAFSSQGFVIYSGRGRPPKNAIKLAPGQTSPDPDKQSTKHEQLQTNQTTHMQTRTPRSDKHTEGRRPKRLQMKAASSSLSDSDVEMASEDADLATRGELTAGARQKPSPSSTSDVTHMEVFEDHARQTDFWRLHCALCSQAEASGACDPSCDALFLCPSCDHKYPTQRALGRV